LTFTGGKIKLEVMEENNLGQPQDMPPTNVNFVSQETGARLGTLQVAAEKKKPSNSSTKYLIIILVLLMLFSTLGVSVYFVKQQTQTQSRASDSTANSQNRNPGQVKLENSYLFASPLQAQAGNGEKIRVTVFLLDDQGRGVPDKTVVLKEDPNLIIVAVDQTTDTLGKAVFDVSARVPGEYFAEGSVDNQLIPQKVTLGFK
jgi:hypothetical protein